MDNIKSDFSSKSNASLNSSSNSALNSSDKSAHELGSKVGHYATQMTDASKDFLKSGQDYVQNNPVKSLIYASTAGAFLGGLVTVFMRRKN